MLSERIRRSLLKCLTSHQLCAASCLPFLFQREYHLNLTEQNLTFSLIMEKSNNGKVEPRLKTWVRGVPSPETNCVLMGKDKN